MSKFGWSYPAGCSGPPDQEDTPCDICGGDPGGCLCPVCSVCGSQGDEGCETIHGILQPFMMGEHTRLKTRLEAVRKADADIEAAWLKADMEADEAYQAEHCVLPDPDEVPYSEHDDSAYQCGKDRDDR